jgi:hypothetical protein
VPSGGKGWGRSIYSTGMPQKGEEESVSEYLKRKRQEKGKQRKKQWK